MATATQPKPAPTLEATIKTAVKAWVKAEQSAIWGLIGAVYNGLQGVYGPDRDTREKSLKTWINQAFEEEYGPGAAKDRAAHISKIFKIALNAKSKDFDRWKKAGTGFYKAYEEFAVPQANPAKKPDVVAVPIAVTGQAPAVPAAGTPMTVTESGTTGTVTINVDEEPKDTVKSAAAIAGSPTAVGAPVFTDTSMSEMAQVWADRIETNKKFWTHLLGHLTNPKHMILTPDMVREAIIAIAKKPLLLRGTVSLLMLNEEVAKEVQEYIKNDLAASAEKAAAKK